MVSFFHPKRSGVSSGQGNDDDDNDDDGFFLSENIFLRIFHLSLYLKNIPVIPLDRLPDVNLWSF